ncbi:MAG: hypothetical protein FK730_16930 [Asgard group archaeon]|nr:hypothetical protein [Asgard group archaeon]
MSNENPIIETQTMSKEIQPEYSANAFKQRMKKGLSFLKPTSANIIVTFITFIVLLAISRNLILSVLICACIYLIVAFLIQPLLQKKFGKNFKVISLKANKDLPELISSNNKSVILYIQKKTLNAIALLRVEWLANIINLNQIWHFLQKEDIQIQDCREGCFLVVRKTMQLKSNKGLEDEAKKLVKLIERTIQLTKKKFDIEYENISLRLVKGQEIVQTILLLGLASGKFINGIEQNPDDYSYLKNNSLYIQNQKLEEQISE